MPVVSPKYDIGLVIKNCTAELLYLLEPWCSTIYVDTDWTSYIVNEQKNTTYDLSKKVFSVHAEQNNDIIVRFDALKLNATNSQFIGKLPLIVQDSGDVGDMVYDIFELSINKIEDKKEELINAI